MVVWEVSASIAPVLSASASNVTTVYPDGRRYVPTLGLMHLEVGLEETMALELKPGGSWLAIRTIIFRQLAHIMRPDAARLRVADAAEIEV